MAIMAIPNHLSIEGNAVCILSMSVLRMANPTEGIT